MTLSILALVFLAGVLVIAILGFRTIIRKGPAPDDLNRERCSICREQFNRSLLIERQVGDHRMLYFCQTCVMSLHNEMVSKN
ncbi:MAG TPA: hypothetical protein VL221_14845 [Bacteroidota bacterium]|nr:hypothetical protein [Bacteroidota bacterium]